MGDKPTAWEAYQAGIQKGLAGNRSLTASDQLAYGTYFNSFNQGWRDGMAKKSRIEQERKQAEKKNAIYQCDCPDCMKIRMKNAPWAQTVMFNEAAT